MASYVELIGSAGVGKTSVYKGVTRRWKDTDSWIPEEYTYPLKEVVTDRKPRKRHLCSYLKYLYSRSKAVPRYERTYARDKQGLVQAEQRFISAHRELIDICLKNMCQRPAAPNGEDYRLYLLTYLQKMFGRIQHICEYRSDSVVFSDEALLHNVGIVLSQSGTTDKHRIDLQRIIQLNEMPRSVFFLEAQPDVIVSRILDRGYRIPIHERLSEEQLMGIVGAGLHVKRLLCEELRRSGVAVRTIDADQPLNIVIDQVSTGLDEINC